MALLRYVKPKWLKRTLGIRNFEETRSTLLNRIANRLSGLLRVGVGSGAGVGVGNLRGIPLLENKKVVGFTKFPFHVFDRYEIHIQAFWDFIYANFIIFPILIFTKYDKHEIRIFSKQKTHTQVVSMTFKSFRTFQNVRFLDMKIILFKDVPICFLYFFEYFCNS